MEIYLDRRAIRQIRLAAQETIEEGDTESLREEVLEAFSEEQVEEIERRLSEDDPRLAEQVSTTSLYTHLARRIRWASFAFLVGFILLLCFALSLELAVTGFAIGGVPPVGHLQRMETYIDEDFLQYPTIWAAAGTPNAIFELKTEDLQKMTDGKVVRVK